MLDIKLTNEQAYFVEWLKKYHSGKQNAVVTKQMRQFGSGPNIRAMVNALRVAGVPICSGRTGYYYAQSSSELESTLNFLESHIRHVRNALNGMQDTYYEMKTEEVIEKRHVQKNLF